MNMCYSLETTKHSTLTLHTYIFFLKVLMLLKHNLIKLYQEKTCTLPSQFHLLTTAKKSIRGPCFAVFVSHILSKIAQELRAVSKWCLSDQKSNDSSMNRTRLAPARPGCWSSGTRIRESSFIPGPVPSSLLTLACSQPPRAPTVLCDLQHSAKIIETLLERI